ncbi:phosphatase PAP2 family protein [Amycolatopsis sp. YIM 10]|uniref:phosphatase PAP2 family protein n=1 Tax=Amycolatopsis sp. YIM 10 TaxID=2653857 RepID=UPI001D159FC2|nr:phosphatase PAP2 family protein [Amycolatopsis sp. YIM 10]
MLIARVRSVVLAGSRDGQRPAPLVEVALLVLVFVVFTWLHGAAKSDAEVATGNALALQSLERALHLDIVAAANRWLVEHPALIQPAVLYYRLYYVVLIGVLVWVFLRHTEVYLKARRTLIAMAVLVLPVFWAVPMSPPRFALPGVVDIIAEHDIFGEHSARALESGKNVFSAMPSMHVGWSLWCAYAAWLALRASRPRLALLPWLFPLGMIAVVFTTGNHYVLDVVGSVVLLLISIAVVRLIYAGPPGSEPSKS